MIVITVIRKPVEGTVAANALKWGCGGMNIDGTRIEHTEDFSGMKGRSSLKLNVIRAGEDEASWKVRVQSGPEQQAALAKLQNFGRFPANMILCPESAVALDEHSGFSKSPSTYTRSVASGNVNAYSKGIGQDAGVEALNYADSGGASRFFKVVGS